MEPDPSWESSVTQLFKNFPISYGTLRPITVFTGARHLSLPWVKLIQSVALHLIYLRSILMLSNHLCLGLVVVSFLLDFPVIPCKHPSLPMCAVCPPSLILLDRHDRIYVWIFADFLGNKMWVLRVLINLDIRILCTFSECPLPCFIQHAHLQVPQLPHRYLLLGEQWILYRAQGASRIPSTTKYILCLNKELYRSNEPFIPSEKSTFLFLFVTQLFVLVHGNCIWF
jgi:hypothetical protein